MGIQYAAKKYADDINKFVEETAKKWSNALAEIGAGTYTSDAFQKDVVTTVTNSVTYLWLPLFGFIGVPALPVAVVTATVAKVTTTGVVTDQPLDTPFDAGTLAATSTLTLVGSTTTTVDCDLGELGGPPPDGLRVTVKLSSPPATGIYHGVASAQVGGVDTIIAMILLTITP